MLLVSENDHFVVSIVYSHEEQFWLWPDPYSVSSGDYEQKKYCAHFVPHSVLVRVL